MDVLIIDQCSNSKSYPDNSISYDAVEIDESSLKSLRTRDGAASIPARKLYTGRQQGYVGEAVESLRAGGHTVDRYFISAGFGLVDENEELPPYNVTFADMTATEIDSRASLLQIPEQTREAVTSEAYDIVFFPLGSDYYRAVDIASVIFALPTETIAVTFNQEDLATRSDNVVSVPARTEQAKEHGEIVVALKGVYLKNFAENLAQNVTITSLEDVTEACLTQSTSQKDLSEF
ncbi:hypothetical protein [Natronobiforma cellulositropha]|uniref:hypothetical protein n=1 Tax=Natronobiforma cellulositropha TaxID=1679076 RepID=UPI0021D5B19B|nr:hypothetical protein [Natronobiforma cellulositropha]